MASLFTNQSFMEDPFSHVDELREEGPFVRTKLPIIGKVWITTTQKAAGIVLKDGKTFSLRKSDGKVTGMQWWMPKTISLLAGNMLTMDEPDHTRLRSLVDRTFRRDVMIALEPRIQKIAGDLAEKLFVGNDLAELITEFSRELPLAVICELLGLAEKDRRAFSDWASSLTRVEGVFSFLFSLRPISKMRRYLAKEIERQRSEPASGLIGELVHMQNEGADISDDELIAMVFLLLIAGHETTTHVISGGVFELLKNPKEREKILRDDKSINLGVEEMLRFVSAVQFTKPRNVRKDVEVEGVQLKQGDVVMPMIVAANGDPELFECPHQMDVSRAPNRHLAFGAGIHFCLGHQLARIEIACAIKALFKHYPDLELAVPESEVTWLSRVGLRVIEKLPVRKGATEIT